MLHKALALARRPVCARAQIGGSWSRLMSSAPASGATRGGTGVVLLNMGGPSTLDEVEPFLSRLFADADLIPLGPLQKWLGPLISKRRTPTVTKSYAEIGGGSPIRKWSEFQAKGMCDILDKTSPETAPHRPYVAFRYAAPLTDETLAKMQADGITRAVAFSQYPQYSCSTTGSSLNELHRQLRKSGLDKTMKWSVIDRWPTQQGLVNAFARLIQNTLDTYPQEERDDVVVLFSAHSLPMSVVNRGDTYPSEVAATAHAVMTALGRPNAFRVVWQSQVGPSAWLGPQTNAALEGLTSMGRTNIAVVPIAFTSDHIETLFELDLEYVHEMHQKGFTGVKRVAAFNGDQGFIQALADIVKEHLEEEQPCSSQMQLRCPGCKSLKCLNTKDFFAQQSLALQADKTL